MKAKAKLTCKTKGCNVEPMVNCNYCQKHWMPANKKEEQLVIPELVKSQFEYYKKKDEERANDGKIHISTLNLCVREKVFQHLHPQPLRPIQLKWFSNGNAIHDKLQTLALMNPDYEREKEVIRGDIIAHIDMYDNKRKFPIEAKSLAQSALEVPKNFHIDQLKMYMALTDDDIGVLLYDPLLAYGDEPFAEWTITMTKQEREDKLKEIDEKAKKYSQAMEKQDPALAPHIAYDTEYNWHCDKCIYYNECMNMNAKAREAVFKK